MTICPKIALAGVTAVNLSRRCALGSSPEAFARTSPRWRGRLGLLLAERDPVRALEVEGGLRASYDLVEFSSVCVL
jgi:hypothetical protein